MGIMSRGPSLLRQAPKGAPQRPPFGKSLASVVVPSTNLPYAKTIEKTKRESISKRTSGKGGFFARAMTRQNKV